jgi:ABC-type multidrug transport system ATPase subunit
MPTHLLEECEKIADRIMVLSDGSIPVVDIPTALRQESKCGYLCETEESNAQQLGVILDQHRRDGAVLIEVNEGRTIVVVSAEEHDILGGIVIDLYFKHLMSLQILKEKVFSHMQEQELSVLHCRDSMINADDEDHRPRL